MGVERIIWNKLNISRGEQSPMVGDKKAGREQLAEIFAEAGYKHGAEIGVFRGDYSQVLCDTIPGLKLICIDPWMPYLGKSERRMGKIFRTTRERLKDYNVVIERKTSVEAVGSVPNDSLDFVYIYGMHEFDFVMADIILWEPKVRRGGIVAGHDYSSKHGWGVPEATQAYVKAHAIPNWYLLKANDIQWSWLWVKKK